MYTKLDLIENRKMEEIIKENQLKVRKFNNDRAKKNKRDIIITNAFMVIGSSTFFIGLTFLITIIENLRF